MEQANLGFTCRPWQERVFPALKKRSVLAVHRRAGKTVLAVMKLSDSALRNPQPKPRYAYIAPRLNQGKDIAWGYIKHYGLKVPRTKVNESELWVEFPNEARVRIYGADNPDSFRGLYFDGIVPDEVAQMKRDLWSEVLQPTLVDRDGWALFLGTPKGINLFSELYYQAVADPKWYAGKQTIYDTGVFTPEKIEEIKKSMSEREFAQEFECSFLASSNDALISIEDARAAVGRFVPADQYAYAPKILGVDVAWKGGDRSVVFRRQGLMSWDPLVEKGLPEKVFASRVASVYDSFGADACFVDNTGGYGGEVVSRLRDMGYRVQPVVFSWTASDKRFRNLRAEMWFKMADWIKEGSIPKSVDLQKELCAPTYDNDGASMKLQLESKKKIKERIGVSPDIADALAITFAYPVAQRLVDSEIAPQYAGELQSASREPIQAKLDYNPYRKK